MLGHPVFPMCNQLPNLQFSDPWTNLIPGFLAFLRKTLVATPNGRIRFERRIIAPYHRYRTRSKAKNMEDMIESLEQ
ncbi:hypothetical protein CR513_34352, partial [Mucuna pruriens]